MNLAATEESAVPDSSDGDNCEKQEKAYAYNRNEGIGKEIAIHGRDQGGRAVRNTDGSNYRNQPNENNFERSIKNPTNNGPLPNSMALKLPPAFS